MSGDHLKVVELRPARGTDDVAATLRIIADGIEAGDPEWPITTAVLVLGYETDRPDGEETAVRLRWRTHGFGPRPGVLSCKGLLAVAINKFDGGDE